MPYSDANEVDIITIKARNYSEAEEKIINKIVNRYDLDVDPLDWDDFLEYLANNTSIYIGEIKEISEFE